MDCFCISGLFFPSFFWCVQKYREENGLESRKSIELKSMKTMMTDFTLSHEKISRSKLSTKQSTLFKEGSIL